MTFTVNSKPLQQLVALTFKSEKYESLTYKQKCGLATLSSTLNCNSGWTASLSNKELGLLLGLDMSSTSNLMNFYLSQEFIEQKAVVGLNKRQFRFIDLDPGSSDSLLADIDAERGKVGIVCQAEQNGRMPIFLNSKPLQQLAVLLFTSDRYKFLTYKQKWCLAVLSWTVNSRDDWTTELSSRELMLLLGLEKRNTKRLISFYISEGFIESKAVDGTYKRQFRFADIDFFKSMHIKVDIDLENGKVNALWKDNPEQPADVKNICNSDAENQPVPEKVVPDAEVVQTSVNENTVVPEQIAKAASAGKAASGGGASIRREAPASNESIRSTQKSFDSRIKEFELKLKQIIVDEFHTDEPFRKNYAAKKCLSLMEERGWSEEDIRLGFREIYRSEAERQNESDLKPIGRKKTKRFVGAVHNLVDGKLEMAIDKVKSKPVPKIENQKHEPSSAWNYLVLGMIETGEVRYPTAAEVFRVPQEEIYKHWNCRKPDEVNAYCKKKGMKPVYEADGHYSRWFIEDIIRFNAANDRSDLNPRWLQLRKEMDNGTGSN